MTRCRRQLLDLPDEILISAIGFIRSHEDLLNATCVSRRFNDLAEPFLYHSIDVVQGDQANILASAIASRRARATWVRTLLVSTKFGEDEGLSRLPPQIRLMRNLQDLRLETPDCNQKEPFQRVSWIALQERYERIFESSSAVVPQDARLLPNLRSCTLHFVDANREIYMLSKYAMLFLHPGLCELTISCASTDYPRNLLRGFQNDSSLVRTTALEYLHLEECDIYPPSLAILLSFAKCLKRLKLSEGTRYTPRHGFHRREHGDINPGEFVDALAQHCRVSLEWLSLSLGHIRRPHESIDHYGGHIDLSNFNNITHLEVDMRTAFLLVPVRDCDHCIWKRVPPNLRSLKVFEILATANPPFASLGRQYWPFADCLVKDKKQHGLSNLELLTYSFITHSHENDGPDPEDEDDEEVEVVTNAYSRTKAKLIAAAATSYPTYKKAGVRLDVVLVSLPHGFIPPYLNAEDSPTEKVIWDRPI